MTAPIYKKKEMLSVGNIAQRWNLSKSLVYQLIGSGKLSAFQFGGSWRVHISNVLEYEESYKHIVGTSLCWIVGRRETPSSQWQIQGVALNKLDAVQMCRDESYFIGPVALNSALPHEQAEWTGCYYPLVEA